MRRTGGTRRMVGFLLIALVAAVVPTAQAGAAHPGTNGAIAFTLAASDCRSYCDNWRDIFLTDPAGAKPPIRRAGSAEKYDVTPDWSPDGNEIVFMGYPWGVGYIDIYKMNADGSNVEALTNNYKNANPKWSPDGTTIAFTRNNSGDWPELWLMDADGTNERKVPIPYYVNALAWMPDGRISFWGNPNTFAVNGLFATDVAGESVEEIVNLDEVSAATGQTQSFPNTIDWSPDGKRGVFAALVPESETVDCEAAYPHQQDLWTVSPTGVLDSVVTTDGDFEVWEAEPAWSPAGNRIAYAGSTWTCVGEGRDQQAVQGYTDLYTMRSDGTNRVQIVDPPSGPGYGHSVMNPSWQPCTTATVVCGRGPGAGGFPIQDETAPVVDGAKRTVPQGAGLGASRLPVRFSWSATDNETPTAELRYDVQIRDQATSEWVNVVSNSLARAATVMLLPNHSYVLRHRARDQWGNVSAFLNSAAFKAEPGQETMTSPRLRYAGAWTRVAREGAYGGYVRTSTEVGATATMTFTGYRGAGVVLPKRTGLGVAKVCLLRTGVDPSCQDIDLGATTALRPLVFARNALNPGIEYRIRVRVMSGRVDLDVFEGLT